MATPTEDRFHNENELLRKRVAALEAELQRTKRQLSELDITDLKQAERREQEQRQRKTELGRILEASRNEIYVFDADSLRFLLVNQGARENLGYSMEEMRELTPVDVKPEFTTDTFSEMVRPLRTGEQQNLQFDTIHRRKDATCYPVEVHLQLATYESSPAFVAVILDTTRRKQAEAAMQAAHEDLQRIMASVSDYLWSGEIDTEGNFRYRYYSPVVERITGHPPEFFMEGPHRWLSTVHPEDRPKLEQGVAQIRSGDLDHAEAEYRTILPDGTVRWMRDSVQVTRLENGVQRLHGVVSDITDRKQLQQGLLRSGLNNIPDGVVIVDEHGRRLVFNPAASAMIGLGATDIDLEQWSPKYGLFLPDGTTPYPSGDLPLARAIRGETVRDAELVVRGQASGSDVLLSVNACPLRDHRGSLKGGVAVFRDITQQRRDEQNLRLTQVAIDRAADMVVWVRPDATLLEVNETTCRRLGYTREELLAMSVHDIDPDMSVERWPDDWQRFRQPGGVTFETSARAKDGTIWPVEIAVNYFGYRGEEFICAIVRDITERRRDAERLRAEQQLLRRLLDLQERERRMVAHDIHDGFVQDVVGAHMQLESLRGRDEAHTAGETLQFVASLLTKAIDEGRRLIRDLRPMVLDEAGIIEAIKHLVADEHEYASLTVAFSHDVQFRRLEPTFEGAVFRIVQEALSNVKHHARTDHATVQVVQQDSKLHVIVRDQGVGFDTNQVAPDRFGLRGIHERARLCDGTATIESTPGSGTAVSVEMPIPMPPKGPTGDGGRG